jgi:membrane fusion protein (multidrug efflux system)
MLVEARGNWCAANMENGWTLFKARRIVAAYPLTPARRLIQLRLVRRLAMKLPKFILPSVFFFAIGLSGCERAKAPPVAANPPQVFVATVEPRDVPIIEEWIGRLDGSANVDIRARVQGYIQEIAFKEGSLVKEGELLLRIDPRPYKAALEQAKAELGRAIAEQQKAEQDEQRQTELFNKKIASQQDYANAVQADLAAKAKVEAARAALDQAQLNLDFATINSPLTGIVGRTDLSVGDYVEAGNTGAPVTTVSTVDPIKLVFSVSEKEYLEVADRLRAILAEALDQREAIAELIRADGKMHPYKGRLLAADRQVDPKTGTIRISAIFPNPGNLLRPGQYARIRIKTAERTGALLVPQRAVLELQGRNFVWVVDEANKVSQRKVTVGQQFGSDWIIEDGLKPGERIVVEGLQKVRDGATVQPSTAPPTTAVAVAPETPNE